ncbi:MAG: tRNA 2-thiouridine(34) synthase MnmA [Clostridia bacterium]|jgi:tRNA-specific 2-thiouridylase|uniref:tRNA 2-thiouridine(34) synthase MnmA n=1 Tax=Pumilibacter muris TaxID=2941510 RepID=UPI0020419586|nr:tRNA 2-thiouridine(34) synthase MnmA [Pumilibacter muris]MCI8596765.1 tRNA 2-thiouridine(34) synthase MnmA [Clostridia bacterium]
MNNVHNLSKKKARVVVGVSGGVDSSVAAELLKEQGYDVIGLFMNNWEEEDEGDSACSAASDWQDARAVCASLDIPVYAVNFAAEYRDRVFSYFLKEYKRGRTPNPDVLCNREIKFGPFADYAKKLGADFIATGHYCALKHADGGAQLWESADKSKDQTYFLNQVRTSQLENVIFPLANLQKGEVREIAERKGLVTARKKDSTGICFIGERNFKKFLSAYLPAKPGKIVDVHGKELGRHDGLMYYTLGQRRGLGIGGIAGENASRWFVVRKDLEKNELIVKCGEGEELMSDSLDTEELNIIGKPVAENKFRCKVKTRYRQPAQNATAFLHDGRAHIEFDSPQRAVTPGQYAVIYVDDGRCLGGGVIK